MHARMKSSVLVLAIVVICLGAGCREAPRAPAVGGQSSPATRTLPSTSAAAPVDYPGIHNVVAYREGVYSGGAPEGERGFESIAAMGVMTVISVDGAEPEIALAKAHGLRYIHLPIGYNGFDESRRRELARALRDSLNEGPVYIHCHHGKHRSAGAAGAALVSLGEATSEEMVARMRVSGTSPSYAGLYRCTSTATVLSIAELDAVPADFPEIARPTGLVKSMVEIDEATEHLKAIEKAGWTVPPDHPDLVPAAEAGRLADLLRLLGGEERLRSKPPEFARLMRRNASEAQTLEDLLTAGAGDASRLSAQYKAVVASCAECHSAFRD